MIIKYLFIFSLFFFLLLAINQSIKRYAESEVVFLHTQLKLIKTLDTLLQVYPDIDIYTTQLPILINKKLAIYKSISQYGLLTPFYLFLNNHTHEH